MKEVTHLFPFEAAPRDGQSVVQGVLVKIDIACRAPLLQPQEFEKLRVVIRKLNSFTDKLKVWEAAGEAGQLQLQRKPH